MVCAISGVNHCSSSNIANKKSLSESNVNETSCAEVKVVVVKPKQSVKPVAKTNPSLAIKIMNVAALGCLVAGGIAASQESNTLGQRSIGITTTITTSAFLLASSMLDKTKAKYAKLALAVAGFGGYLFLINQSTQPVQTLREADSCLFGTGANDNPLDCPINARYRLDAYDALERGCLNNEDRKGEKQAPLGAKFSLNPETHSLYNINSFSGRTHNDMIICGPLDGKDPTHTYGCTPEPKEKMSLTECYMADRHSEDPFGRVRVMFSECNKTTGTQLADAQENMKLIERINGARAEIEEEARKLIDGAYAPSNRLLDRYPACRQYLTVDNAHLQREYKEMSNEEVRKENSWTSLATKITEGAFKSVFTKIANKAKSLVG